MASLDEEEFGSDTDDDDYVPDGDTQVASEEENSGDDEGTEANTAVKGAKKKKSKIASKPKPAGRASMFGEEEEKIDWSAELEKEKTEKDEEQEKKKTENIWAAFKKETSTKVVVKPKPAGGGLANLFSTSSSPSSSSQGPSKITAEPTKPKSRFGNLFDVGLKKGEVKEEEKKDNSVKPKNRFGSLFDSPSDKEEIKEDSKDSITTQDGKVEITKTYDFAGEAVTISKQVNNVWALRSNPPQVCADSKEAAKFLSSSADTTSKRPGGLAGVVGSMAKVHILFLAPAF